MADNDSFANDPDVLIKSAADFNKPGVAAVQLRNVARPTPGQSPLARLLSPAIDAFDAFLSGLFSVLWTPFVGHNAILDTRAVMDVGGFQAGMFADDLDLTVRLNLAGYRVLYRRDLEMQEQHPASYRSFCLRSRKWALGCAQMLKKYFWKVIASNKFTMGQKLGFTLFTGVYVIQVAMVLYLILLFFIWPIAVSPAPFPSAWSLAVGTLLPLSIFFPVVAYLLTEGRALPFVRTLAGFIAVYGSVDWWTLRGLIRGMRNVPEKWQPTNRIADTPQPLTEWSHFTAGTVLLLAALIWQPALTVYPLTWLFCAKYLFVPAIAIHYGNSSDSRTIPLTIIRASGLVVIAITVIGILVFAYPSLAANPESSEKRTPAPLLSEKGAIVKGIHYSPWRPGTGPGREFAYPDDELLASDLELIHATGANAIIVYDAPARFLDIAADFDLAVLYAVHVEWWQLAGGREGAIEKAIAERVGAVAGHSTILGWMMGNEMPGWVLDKIGVEAVRDFLNRLRSIVRAEGSEAPVCYGNWPPTRHLELDRELDMLCYNVYPFYPTEVAVQGFGNFIADELMPLAEGRPMLITEFGINTVEASPEQQAEMLAESWHDLVTAGAAGGFVFEFADEWWKNYDNPVQPPDWWRREPAPEDHLTHDDDPEEAYGIVTADRKPKPAYEVVRNLFSNTSTPSAPVSGEESGRTSPSSLHFGLWIFAGALVMLALAARLWRRRK